MEALVEAGFIKGVLDITTTEWCDELVGGVFNAGPSRLEAAAKHGVAQVVSVGALDMVNFGSMDTVPEKFKGRNLYVHNPTVTLMRTTVEENQKLGDIIIGRRVAVQLEPVDGVMELVECHILHNRAGRKRDVRLDLLGDLLGRDIAASGQRERADCQHAYGKQYDQ